MLFFVLGSPLEWSVGITNTGRKQQPITPLFLLFQGRDDFIKKDRFFEVSKAIYIFFIWHKEILRVRAPSLRPDPDTIPFVC